MINIRVGFLLSALFLSTLAWIPASTQRKVKSLQLQGASDDTESAATRRRFLETTAASIGICTALPYSANALVKGVAPPPKKSQGDKPKCTNVEECQDMAEKRDQKLREIEEQGPPPMVTSTGVKYRDTEDGSGDRTVKDGDQVELSYKLLKLGKRSYDGLSGEGTVVFSRGMYVQSGCVR
jgi:FKBP-type peptidyl-prolyl cis-trans isomerase